MQKQNRSHTRASMHHDLWPKKHRSEVHTNCALNILSWSYKPFACHQNLIGMDAWIAFDCLLLRATWFVFEFPRSSTTASMVFRLTLNRHINKTPLSIPREFGFIPRCWIEHYWKVPVSTQILRQIYNGISPSRAALECKKKPGEEGRSMQKKTRRIRQRPFTRRRRQKRRFSYRLEKIAAGLQAMGPTKTSSLWKHLPNPPQIAKTLQKLNA